MEKDDLRMLYSVSVGDIHNFKGQQWKVTNYVLLLYAAFISITKLVKEQLYCFEVTILCVATVAIAIVGCYFTRRLHKSIKLRQGRLALIQDEIGDEFKQIWKGGMSEEEIASSKKDVLWLFWSVQIIAAVIVFWLILRPFIKA